MDVIPVPKTVPVKTAARTLRVHRQTIYALIAAGSLAATRIGGRWEIAESSLVEFATPTAPASTPVNA